MSTFTLYCSTIEWSQLRARNIWCEGNICVYYLRVFSLLYRTEIIFSARTSRMHNCYLPIRLISLSGILLSMHISPLFNCSNAHTLANFISKSFGFQTLNSSWERSQYLFGWSDNTRIIWNTN